MVKLASNSQHFTIYLAAGDAEPVFDISKAVEQIGASTSATGELDVPIKLVRCDSSKIEFLIKDLQQLQAANSDGLLLISSTLLGAEAGESIRSILSIYSEDSLPIVVFGSPVDARLLVEAMRNGADDYLTEDTPLELIVVKLEAQIRVCNARALMAQQHHSISENHALILREQQMAKEVFDKVAHERVELSNIRHWLSPIAVFNGDVLLATPTPSGGLLVLMGDFTGHGLGAAIGAIPLASTFYGMAQKGFAIHDIVKELNSKLHEILPTGVFCCACVAQLDFASSVAEVWNAGLPDCYILRKDQGGDSAVEPIPSSALALGILGPRAFSFESQRYTLMPGDKLYLLTDGLLETENARGEQYGEQRLIDVLSGVNSLNIDACFDAVKRSVLEYIGEHARADDISLVEVNAVEASEFERFFEQDSQFASQLPVSWNISYEFRPDSLRHQDPVPLILHCLLEEPNLRPHSGRLFSIISELFNNALDHGLLQLSSDLKYQKEGFAAYYEARASRLAELEHGSVRFELDYRASDREGLLKVDVIDSGQGFDPSILQQKNDDPALLHGRGLALVRSICSKVEFLGSGNHARVEYSW